ncbi:uncharacterized protein LOC134284730 [Aedes albopictus]|uniref:Uncharacterized protein n=1 Tax=Aedes albopictus TaxID=7160 RepID=A0ABM1XRC4_AEDAL|nr:uncharacterized protein LOC109410092 [Aedes albopictus]
MLQEIYNSDEEVCPNQEHFVLLTKEHNIQQLARARVLEDLMKELHIYVDSIEETPPTRMSKHMFLIKAKQYQLLQKSKNILKSKRNPTAKANIRQKIYETHMSAVEALEELLRR